MLYSETLLKSCTLTAIDGELGKIHEIYFDDKDWVVRYFVAELGNWLTGRRVLLSPEVAGEPDTQSETIPIRLTRDQIEKSPTTDFDRPIDETHQFALATHYGWPAYWGAGMGTTTPFMFMPLYPVAGAMADVAESDALLPDNRLAAPPATIEGAHAQVAVPPSANVHLRSSRAIEHYGLATRDAEELGHAADLIIEFPSWRVRYLVGDTRKWLPGREVLLSPQWIDRVDWHDRKVYLGVNREKVESAPAYIRERGITRQDEVEVFQHFAQPAYWTP